MKWIILILFLLTAILLIYGMLNAIFFKKNHMENRLNRYLYNTKNNEESEKQKFKLTFDLRVTKQTVRQKFLTKEKNNKLEMLLNRAGVPLKPEEYLLFQWIATALGVGLFLLLFNEVIIGPIGGIIGFMIPRIIIKKKQNDRLKKFNEGLPEMIATVIGGLRAGFSFPQSLKSVMEEAQSPMKEEIETVLREMQYGTSIEDALNNLKERMPSEDLDLMIQAIVIQRQVGGNLATILEKIVETIRSRMKIQGLIRTLTAQGRLSGIVIGLLPLIIGLILFMMQPSYMGVLFKNTIGIIMVVIAAISCTIGLIVIRKLTTIEV